MNPSIALTEATVQEIHLELIRRTKFNAFDGEKVFRSLTAHRDLWLAVLLDRPGVPDYSGKHRLPLSGLIKLHDLPHNYWNADTLFILTKGKERARQLAQIAESEEWCGEIAVHEDVEETDRALGVGRQDYGLVSIWWD